MENFTPVSAFIGGMMIGAAAVFLMLLQGRIAGISGILGGLLQPKSGEVAWRLAFVAGLIAAPVTYRFVSGGDIAVEIPPSSVLLIVGGLLVGIGTRLGGGCTSGHGVCGISRLSLRSILATAVFITTGIITVYIVRHLVGG